MSVAVSHDGAWVVSGSKDRGVQFWDSRTAIVQCMLQGHKNSGESFFRKKWEFANVPHPSDIHRFESGWEYLGYRQWGLASTDMYVSLILQSLLSLNVTNFFRCRELLYDYMNSSFFFL